MRGSAFGLEITTALPLPGRWSEPLPGSPQVHVQTAPADVVRSRFSGVASFGWRGVADRRPFVAEHGRDGDLRMRLEPSVEMHLDPTGATLLVAGHDADPVATARVLLDSGLFTVSLWHGNEALHAGAVATDTGVLAIAGPSGSGKSTLVDALLAASCRFVSDDVLVLRRDGDRLLGLPGPPVMTVPKPLGDGSPGVIADLGPELWVARTDTAPAAPLAGLVCLQPAGAAGPPDWRSVLLHVIRFPRTPERELARFELASEIAAHVPVLALPARSATAGALAARVLDWRTAHGE